jgi:putative redox protein
MSSEADAIAEWRGGMAFTTTSGSGFSLTLDSSPDLGGSNQGPQPMEALLLALAGCTGMSVLSALGRARAGVTGYNVKVHGERAETYPKVFTRIAVEHTLRGRGLSAAAVKRAVELAATRYCAVSATLGEVADISETWRIVDADSGEEIKGDG